MKPKGASEMAKELKQLIVIIRGTLRFEVENREFQGDCGPSVKVFGNDDQGNEAQLLRFDIFEHDPHYHYRPDGPDDDKWRIDKQINNPHNFVSFVLGGVHGDIVGMLKKVGASTCAQEFEALGSDAHNDLAEQVYDAMCRVSPWFVSNSYFYRKIS